MVFLPAVGGAVEGSGYVSPVVAYHAGTDRFLIFDVASYK
jgi:hypothetical protein